MQLTKWVHEPIWKSKVKVIHWPWSNVTQIQHFQTSFPEKPLGRLKPNFMSQWNGGTKVCSNGPSIYGKNMKHSSSLEPICRWPWKFVSSIGYSNTTKFVQMMTLSWPWPILRQDQIWSIMPLYGKKLKQWSFQKRVVCDLKVGRCSQLNEYNESLGVPKVKVTNWPWSKSLNIFKLLFLNNH